MEQSAGCGCQYDAGGKVFVDHCVCPPAMDPNADPIQWMLDQLAAAHARVAELEAKIKQLRPVADAVRTIRAGGAEPIFDDDPDAEPTPKDDR